MSLVYWNLCVTASVCKSECRLVDLTSPDSVYCKLFSQIIWQDERYQSCWLHHNKPCWI